MSKTAWILAVVLTLPLTATNVVASDLDGTYMISVSTPTGGKGVIASWDLHSGPVNGGNPLQVFTGTYAQCIKNDCDFEFIPLGNNRYKIEVSTPADQRGVVASWDLHLGAVNGGNPLRVFTGTYDQCSKNDCTFQVTLLQGNTYKIEVLNPSGQVVGVVASWDLHSGPVNGGNPLKVFTGTYDQCVKNDCDFTITPTPTGVKISPDVPHDVTTSTQPYPNVSLTDLAYFAWQEFVALNYPADTNHRGQARPGSKLGDTAVAVVWETYWHRVEIFPYDQNPAQSSGKPVVTGKPTYKYDPTAFDYSTSWGGSGPMPTPNLWNNLDEDNELNVDKMFAHVSFSNGMFQGFTDDNRVLYEAKMNYDGFKYILEKELYKTATRDAYAAASSMPANLQSYGSRCGVTQANITSLPCGQIGGAEGNIEIKAAWRRLTTAEAQSGKYHTNSVMHYKSVSNSSKWFVDTYGLVGLHIIHKTVNFPSYVYATFEHVDNIASGIGYIDEITQTGRGSGDVAGSKVIIGSRDNPIPKGIAAVNTMYQSAISNTVWRNYQLIGVQAFPKDYAQRGTSVADLSTYFLANIMIESNEELQNFRGKKPADTQDVDNMYNNKGMTLNMGGCMGCHGVGQLKGGDFNFLIVNSPFGAPEVVGASGTISFRKIKSYADVQAMFQDYVMLNGININGSPHQAFWTTLTYDDFITGNVPHVSPTVKIVNCGDSASSAIVQILLGAYASNREMPAGGPYFPEAQVKEFAKWVDNNCPK